MSNYFNRRPYKLDAYEQEQLAKIQAEEIAYAEREIAEMEELVVAPEFIETAEQKKARHQMAMSFLP